jgi:hypothetical protein
MGVVGNLKSLLEQHFAFYPSKTIFLDNYGIYITNFHISLKFPMLWYICSILKTKQNMVDEL